MEICGSMNEKILKTYIIYCSTGCSCCNEENHYRGPFSSREKAEEARKSYRELPLLASQYARKGNYDISEYEAEQLPDGRIIVEDKVFPGFIDQPLEDADTNDFSWE